MRALAICSAWIVVVLAPARAHAITQPDGTAIPTAMGCDAGHPTGLAPIFASQCTQGGPNIGAPCPGNVDPNSCDNGQHGTCETTLWHSWNDNSCIPSNQSGLSPQQNGSTTPETFQPTCALTFTLLGRGTAQFHDVFGWYNVTSHAPAVADLHVMLDCNAAPGTQVVLDLVGDPDYAGGEIGFFIATPESRTTAKQCAGGNCCADLQRLATDGYVYYSQRELNPDASGGNSYIHLLDYDSLLTAHKFYFAWEDLYAGGGNNDFTDIVTSVDGVECSGGGQSCDTGMTGLCAQGVSMCANGQLECSPLFTGEAETCDGVDQDCDGKIDEGATCPDGEVCDRGACTPSCMASGEFDTGCTGSLVCDETRGVCVDPACNGVACPAGQVCSGGTCADACSNVTCPHGSQCFMGRCIDRCDHVECATGQVCVDGACLDGCNACDGIQCGSGTVCGSGGGACVDPTCPSGCPAGTYCDNGQCLDDCSGAVCPMGEVCQAGHCEDPNAVGGGSAGARPRVGCMCSAGAGAGWVDASPIVLALGLVVLRRRRRPSTIR